MTLEDIKTREDFPNFLNANNLLGDGVEVGVCFGGHAELLRRIWQGRMLYLVDPWEQQDSSVYREPSENQGGVLEKRYREVCEKASKWPGRTGILRAYSVNASLMFADQSLDFGYLDGNHSYAAVTADLESWWPKVKTGGILGGHDYVNKTDEGWHCEVKRAVNDWVAGRNLKIVDASSCYSFFIQKP